MALINDQKWSSVIWISAGAGAAILTFWYPVAFRQQWASHRVLIQSAWFTFLPAVWSLGHFIYLAWLCRTGGKRGLLVLGFILLLGILIPVALLARRLWL